MGIACVWLALWQEIWRSDAYRQTVLRQGNSLAFPIPFFNTETAAFSRGKVKRWVRDELYYLYAVRLRKDVKTLSVPLIRKVCELSKKFLLYMTLQFPSFGNSWNCFLKILFHTTRKNDCRKGMDIEILKESKNGIILSFFLFQRLVGEENNLKQARTELSLWWRGWMSNHLFSTLEDLTTTRI